jgi:hypothetical protein
VWCEVVAAVVISPIITCIGEESHSSIIQLAGLGGRVLNAETSVYEKPVAERCSQNIA